MKLYIANCTNQKHRFNYKLPENTQPFFVDIEKGKQIQLPDMSGDFVDYIISQHEGYGLTEIKKVNKNFSGICYSIDRPISVSALINAQEQKIENLENSSQEILEHTAAAAFKNTEQKLIEAGHQPIGAPLEISIESEPIDPNVETKAKPTKRTIRVENK
ncbi:MAG TPA: hypothetical protein ACHBX6_13140 [Arsenophonus nasoniae]|uniref:hypothetical protein n=1 Tax=Arsenophonus nasoniae TaxID=638 RepID=UPI00387A805A